jgi:ribosomal protein L16 Arg81 hydroxylase
MAETPAFAFERLIAPIGTDTFLRDHWEQRPLLIERGDPSCYASLFSAADVAAIVGFRQLKHSQLKIAQVATDGQSNKVFYVDGGATSDVNQLFHSYAQGETAVLNFAQCYWEPAARLCSAFEHFFHFPAGANVYITPRNARGFPPHFDSHDVFVLQVEGTKLWRIYDRCEQPLAGSQDDTPVRVEQLGPAKHELRLQAGDLLYIPRGYVHEARTTDASSIHISIGVRSYSWSDLVGELLALETQRDPELRRALPAGFSSDAGATSLIADRLPALIAALARSDRMEQAVDRLRERLIARMQPLPDSHLRSLDQLEQLELDTRVEKRAGMLCHVALEGDSVGLAFPGNRMRGPAAIEPAFRFIADASDAFPVRALPSILSDRSKLVLAKRAIREGLLTIAS